MVLEYSRIHEEDEKIAILVRSLKAVHEQVEEDVEKRALSMVAAGSLLYVELAQISFSRPNLTLSFKC